MAKLISLTLHIRKLDSVGILLYSNIEAFIKSKLVRFTNVSVTEVGVGCYTATINDFFSSSGIDPKKVIYVYAYNNNGRHAFLDLVQFGDGDTLLIKSSLNTTYTYIDARILCYG